MRVRPQPVSPDSSLARWVHRQSLGPQTGPWDMYFSRDFANLWYGARAAGEQIRGLALERLYRARPLPGGPHPDPREPGVF
jgi:hypothetical protein